MDINRSFSRAEEVSKDLMGIFLAPYKSDCQYLKRALFYYPPQELSGRDLGFIKGDLSGADFGFIKGDFKIPESCYIDDTGHFNSVEFNICYNQIFYILIAYLVQQQLLPHPQAVNRSKRSSSSPGKDRPVQPATKELSCLSSAFPGAARRRNTVST